MVSLGQECHGCMELSRFHHNPLFGHICKCILGDTDGEIIYPYLFHSPYEWVDFMSLFGRIHIPQIYQSSQMVETSGSLGCLVYGGMVMIHRRAHNGRCMNLD